MKPMRSNRPQNTNDTIYLLIPYTVQDLLDYVISVNWSGISLDDISIEARSINVIVGNPNPKPEDYVTYLVITKNS